ncbi:MAG: TetR/AcrR family transcriptional regulator [Dysosmobacter sp.]|nr:TetR/AcrR family transcriptional regulator [Dysosmobacter sp.]
MPKKNGRNTKGRIISAAWKLFYEQGYENTTVEDIVFESETSKGSFYHYFEGKDALLGTLAYVFDEKYEELMAVMDPELGAMEKLIYLNHELFAMIDGGISMDLLARLLSTQLLARGEKHLLDRNRTYFKLLRQIITEGQKTGQLRGDFTVNEIVKAYALWERALMYDWCLAGGEYSLVAYTDSVTPMFLESYRGKTISKK